MIKIGTANIRGARIGVSLGAGTSDFEIGALTTTDVGVAVEVRDAPRESLLSSLGLPPSTPPEVVIEALTLLKGVQSAPIERQVSALRGSRLESMLSVGGNLASIVSLLLPLLQK
ncbi:hypothetical protein [Janthinobacterium sp. RB2R34]|uniref:hypothetical protein n=1 Tax=Janthinobacterium sp. RB2R34 TaxID=3424193 RepID=UPI003F288AE7